MQGLDDDWCRLKQRAALGDGTAVAFVDTGGPGPVHLLLHGYSDTSRSFRPLLPHLKAGSLGPARLIIPDLPGHGESPMRTLDGIAALTDHVEALLDGLGVTPARITGHSLGSLVALSLAARPRLEAVRTTVLAGTACPAEAGLGSLEAIRGFAPPLSVDNPFFSHWYHGPRPLDPAFLQAVRAEAAAMPVPVWHHYVDLIRTADIRPLLGRIRGPVLAISGTEDMLFDASHGRTLAGSIPDIRLLRLPDIGHNPHWDDPAGVAGLMG